MKRTSASILLALVVLIGSASVAQALEKPRRETFLSGKATRVQYVFVPESLSASTPAPLLMVLHGSGGDGFYMARLWTDLATREGFVISAPQASDNQHWRLKQDSPQVLNDAINAIAARRPIDRRRVYLFGQSGGAVYALTLAMLESEYFAAIAIHAGGWRTPKEFAAIQLATRKIPIRVFVGDRDEFFPLKGVQQTVEALNAAGHPTTLTVIPRHGHSFQEVASQVNVDAWAFLKTQSLEAGPKLRIYN